MLSVEEENNGVRRMLGVCSEFERIANVILERAEREVSSRRKRKGMDDGAKNSHKAGASHARTPHGTEASATQQLVTPRRSVDIANVVRVSFGSRSSQPMKMVSLPTNITVPDLCIASRQHSPSR